MTLLLHLMMDNQKRHTKSNKMDKKNTMEEEVKTLKRHMAGMEEEVKTLKKHMAGLVKTILDLKSKNDALERKADENGKDDIEIILEKQRVLMRQSKPTLMQ